VKHTCAPHIPAPSALWAPFTSWYSPSAREAVRGRCDFAAAEASHQQPAIPQGVRKPGADADRTGPRLAGDDHRRDADINEHPAADAPNTTDIIAHYYHPIGGRMYSRIQGAAQIRVQEPRSGRRVLVGALGVVVLSGNLGASRRGDGGVVWRKANRKHCGDRFQPAAAVRSGVNEGSMPRSLF
jgi:hypothetical protein